MTRSLPFSCLVCLLAVAPVLAQAPPQPPPPAAAPEPASPATSFLARLLDSEAWTSEFLSSDHLRLTGQVELVPPGGQIKFFADQVDIYLGTNRLEAHGNVVFSEPEGRIAADRVEFDLSAGTGTFHDASGIMSMGRAADPKQFAGQDPDVYFYGETIEKLGPRKYKLTRGAFTTCVQPTPRWEVTSSTVVITLNDYAYARNTLLRVKGVPVLYMPVIYYPIQDDERATGFLLPTYGTSTYRGQAVSNGFFWAIARNQDATFFHDWFTKSGQGAGGEYRYIADAQSAGNLKLYRFGRKETSYTQNGATTTLPANSSFEVAGTVSQRITRQLRARARVDYFSDIITQQLYHQNIFQATRSTRTIDGGLSGTFGAASTSVQFQRNEYLSSSRSSSVYGNTPRVAASLAPQMLFGTPIYASASTEFAHIPNQQLTDGVVTNDRTLNKWDLTPSLRVPLSRLTYLSANTSATYRTTYYSRSVDAAGNLTPVKLMRQFLALRSEFVGPVLTKIWDTPDSEVTERMKHVIEPTFSVDYTTEIANQAQVPRLNDASDFVVGGAARMSYGVNNRLFYRGRGTGDIKGVTREFVTIGVQQSYYTNPQSSLYDTSYVSYSGRPRAVDLSPIAVTARVSPTTAFDANTRVEYDVSGNGLQVFSTGGTFNTLQGSANVNFSRSRPNPAFDANSFLSGSTSMRFRDGRVTGLYALSWDVARGYVVSQTVATSYMAQCCGFQVEFQNFSYQPQTGVTFPSDRRFNVSLVLAGLGSISNFFGAFGGPR